MFAGRRERSDSFYTVFNDAFWPRRAVGGTIVSMVGRTTWMVVAGLLILGCDELDPEFDGPLPPSSTAGTRRHDPG